MDNSALVLIFTITAWALGAILSLIIAYWVIRAAITGALRSHHYWLQKNE